MSILPLGFAVIAGVTLFFAIAWGIYSAWRYFQLNDHLIETRVDHLTQLEKGDVDIPILSLRECDRLFLCGQINASSWTISKKIVKRAWVGLMGIGAGIVILKLSAYGLTTYVLTALGITTSIAFFPMLCVFLLGGLLYAAWRIYDYQLKSQ